MISGRCANNSMKVVITEAGSSVAYHLLYMLGKGDILGNQVERDKWPFTYEGLDGGIWYSLFIKI